MNDPRNVRPNASRPFPLLHSAVRAGLQGVFAFIAVGCLAAPGLSQVATGAGTRAQPDTQPKKVTATGPAKNNSRKMVTKTPKGQMNLPSRVVLVFATDAKGGISDQLSDVITDTIQGRLATSGQFASVYFLRSIPTVKRALNEVTLTPNEISHPYDDDLKLKKLMPLTGYDMALTTSIDSYTFDDKKNQVTMLISARLIDFSGSKPIVRAAAENGSSPDSGGNAKEITIASRLAKDLTEKLMTSLLAPSKRADITMPPSETGSAAKKPQ